MMQPYCEKKSTKNKIKTTMDVGEKKVLLVPECGGDAGFYFIQYIKEHHSETYYVVGIDAQDSVAAKYIADAFICVPYYTDGLFLEEISKIIKQFSVTELVSTFENGISLREHIVQTHDLDICNGFANMKLFKDKYATFQRARAHGVPAVETWGLSDDTIEQSQSYNGGWYLKPRYGSGSKMNFTCDTYEQLQLIRKYIADSSGEEYIVQPLIKAEQWSVDIVINDSGCYYFTRKCLSVQGSKVSASMCIYEKQFDLFIQQCVQALGEKGVYNIDCFVVDGNVYILEINPRLSGGSMYCIKNGFNIYEQYFSTVTGLYNSKELSLHCMNIYNDAAETPIHYVEKAITCTVCT